MIHSWDDCIETKKRHYKTISGRRSISEDLGANTHLTFFFIVIIALLIFAFTDIEGLFRNFFNQKSLLDGLAVGTIIGLLLHFNRREKEKEVLVEDEELAKQQEAEVLGFIDYRSLHS